MKIDDKEMCPNAHCKAHLNSWGRYNYSDHSIKCTMCGKIHMLPLPGFNPIKARSQTIQA